MSLDCHKNLNNKVDKFAGDEDDFAKGLTIQVFLDFLRSLSYRLDITLHFALCTLNLYRVPDFSVDLCDDRNIIFNKVLGVKGRPGMKVDGGKSCEL